jgi:tetratricopeptide (TPR) repeat protein
MADQTHASLCPDDRMNILIAALKGDGTRASSDLDALLRDYPRDPRLHFMKGSLLASQQEYGAARAAMRHAVDLAPNYAVARFQLGFLLLTSGEPHAALEAWGPLHSLPPENALRKFVDGLSHLIQDEFDEAIRSLEQGIARNTENLPMNTDMQLIIDEIRKLDRTKGGPKTATSSVDLLLQQVALKATKH